MCRSEGISLTQGVWVGEYQIGGLLQKCKLELMKGNEIRTSTFQSVDRKTCSILRRPIVVSVAVMAHSWSMAASCTVSGGAMVAGAAKREAR
jgi:hypothetical protein